MNLDLTPEELIKRFSEKRILVVGDLMLDQFIRGSVNRISPEAPVPVLEVESDTYFLGGAANVARNLAEFTSFSSLAGRLGNDDAASLVRTMLKTSNIKDLTVSDCNPTTLKTRVVAGNQQIVRIDRENKKSSNKIADILINSIVKIINDIDAIIIEDYGKGLITDYFLDKLDEILPKSKIVMVDPNPSNDVNLTRGYHTIKPNKSEALFYSSEKVIEYVGEDLLEKWNCDNVLITMGKDGMALFSSEGDFRVNNEVREVYDVSGAGDTSIAIYTLAICSGLEPKLAMYVANKASSISVSKAGTSPVEKEELLKELSC